MLLLDTNVISELRNVRRGRTDPNFMTWAKGLRWNELYLSVITIYEIRNGILRLEGYDVPQADIVRLWFEDKVLVRFEDRILPVTSTISLRAAELQFPRTRQVEDALIAATAYQHRMTLVTRNVGDFKEAGIGVINPWDAQ